MGQRNKQPVNTGKALLFALLFIAVAAAAGLGAWFWQRQEVTRLNDRIVEIENEQSAEVSRLNIRIQQLEGELSAALARPEPGPSETPTISNEYTSPKGVIIQVDTPQQNAKVTSPLTVSGQVPGTWSFEADFPVQLQDGAGNVLAEVPARLLGDWMTEELVPFEATLTFTSPGGGTGSLVLQKNNPSGLPDKDDVISIPVSF